MKSSTKIKFTFLLVCLSIFNSNLFSQQAGTYDFTFSQSVGSGSHIGYGSYIIKPLSDNKILLGGEVGSFDGVSNDGLVRLLPNGLIDVSFNFKEPGGGSAYFTDIDFQKNGRIVLFGDYIYRILSNGRIDSTFANKGRYIGIWGKSIVNGGKVMSDDKILFWGNFKINNSSPSNICRLLSNGLIDTTFNTGTGPNTDVYCGAVQKDGKLIIGGDFSQYNGALANRLCRINTDGSLDKSFDVGLGPNSWVNSIAIQNDGKILITGERINYYNGNLVKNFIRINTNGSLDNSFKAEQPMNQLINTKIFVQPDNKILTSIECLVPNQAQLYGKLVRFNSDGSLDKTFNSETVGRCTEIAIQNDGKILVAAEYGYQLKGNSFIRNPLRLYGSSGAGVIKNIYNKTLISPNPFESKLNIVSEVVFENLPFTIVNNLGKIILEGSLNGLNPDIPLPELPKGIYFIKMGGLVYKLAH